MRDPDVYDFNRLAADVAKGIDKISGGPPQTMVLVPEFEEPGNLESQLARALTQEFSRSLISHAKNFTVLDRSAIESAIAIRKLPVGALSSSRATACYATKLEASMIVEASIEYSSNKMTLSLKVENVQPDGDILSKTIIAPLTPEMESLKSKGVALTEAYFGEDKTVWVKGEESQPRNPPLPSGTPGYSYPACISCPQARYSDAAVKARFGGTTTLSVVIGADGTAQQISVQRALPCDLDQQAIDAMKDWKFKPAYSPDGNSAAVLQLIEVTFHIY
jgi:TonB family protein